MTKNIFLALLFVACNHVQAQQGLLDTLSMYVEDFQQEVEKEGGTLWGVPFKSPLLIQTKDFLVSSVPVQGFEHYKNVYYGIADDYKNGANSCVDWRGQKRATFVYNQARFDDRQERLNLFFHESFHCNQYELQLNGTFTPCAHFNEFEARCLLRLEYNALLQVFKNQTIDTTAIIDALSFRAYRYALYPNAYKEETIYEISEGTANYTGYKLSGKTEEEFIAEMKLEVDFNPQYFAYLTGAMYGFILDRLNTQWRKQISNKDNFLYLTLFLTDIRLPDGLTKHCEITRKNYNWNGIKSSEKNKDKEVKQLEKRYNAMFFHSSVVHIARDTSQNYSFGALLPFKDGMMLKWVSTSGNWGTFWSTGEVFVRENEFLLPKPIEITDSSIKGESWEMWLNPDWELQKISKNRYTVRKLNE
jgi:hypothetical protein